MNTTQQSPQFLRKRKFLTMLPLIALPFLTFLFWSLGGGQQAKADGKDHKGLNAQVPGANTSDDKNRDKMSYYEDAALDSAKRREQKKNDPYYQGGQVMVTAPQNTAFSTSPGQQLNTMNGNYGYSNNYGTTNPNEQRIYQKLGQLNAAMTQSQEASNPQPNSRYATPGAAAISTADIDRLERMMQAMNQPAEQDPEMQQLNGMLEKIMNIQNPELIQEKLRKVSEQRKGRVFPISGNKPPELVSSLDKPVSKPEANPEQPINGFYSFDKSQQQPDSQNAVQAVIHETQTLVNGATVKMRLASDIYINGVMIPRETFVYGMASLNGERLAIKINGIRYQNNLFPVELAVFDLDGLDGIYIPGAINREVAKEGADKGLQSVGLNTLDPSLGMQAATVGVETAKSLFSKKVKLVRVTVKAGYQVLLRDDKQKQEQ